MSETVIVNVVRFKHSSHKFRETIKCQLI